MKIEPGAMPAPQLRLVRVLGRGGMGAVWEAEHLTLKNRVAVKFMLDRFASNGPETARFVREATAAAQVKSPHVAQVFDHGFTEDGTPYIVMELLEGESLADRLGRAGRIGLRETAGLVTQACRALTRAHAQGIVHRDIKPDNLFLTDQEGDPFVKLVDFGVAKRPDEDGAAGMTATGSVVGTPYYMSPEQMASSKHVDARADLWSLGVVAYRCLTGAHPFDGGSIGAVCLAIERGTFAAPSSIVPELGTGVDGFFARALARSPDDRFQTARELGEALDALASQHGDEITMVGRARPPRARTAAAFDLTVRAPTRLDTPADEGPRRPTEGGSDAAIDANSATIDAPTGADVAAPPGGFGLRTAVAVAVVATLVGVAATLAVSRLGGPATSTVTSTAPDATVAGSTREPTPSPAPLVAPAPGTATASADPARPAPTASAPMARPPRAPAVSSSPPAAPVAAPGPPPRDRGF